MIFRTSLDKLQQDALYEAERKALEHRMAAEHHQALATMYDERAKRLRKDLDEKQASM